MKRTVAAFICMLCIASCKNDSSDLYIDKTDGQNGWGTLSIESYDDHVKASKLFGEIEIVPLETNSESILSSIDRVKVTDELILVMDRIQNRGLYVFDRNGMHKYTLADQGGGPGELSHPEDFYINEEKEKIGLFDRVHYKMVYYDIRDGSFSHEKQANIRAQSFKHSGGDTYLFHYDDINDQVDVDHYLFEYSFESMSSESNYLSVSDYRRDFSFMDTHNFNIHGEDTLFYYAYNDTIYQINDNIPEPKYYIDLGQNKLDYNSFFRDNDQSTYRDEVSDSDYARNVQNFFKNDSYIHFTYRYGSDIMTSIFEYGGAENIVFNDLNSDVGTFEFTSYARNTYRDKLIYTTQRFDDLVDFIDQNKECCIDSEVGLLHLEADQDFENPNPAIIIADIKLNKHF